MKTEEAQDYKEIKITKGFVAIVDVSDFDTLNKYKWHLRGIKSKYAAMTIGPKGNRDTVLMHKAIVGTRSLVDHKNGNGLDNRRHNLRPATYSINSRNVGPRGKSKFKGVSACRDKWVSRIVINKSEKYLGIFLTQEQAAIAYNNAAFKYGVAEYTRLNTVL